ncbi:MAG: iron chelate uptake ABC transporter family permease subunit [Planctomycetota bacterium]|jgi:iron complex transport system permease protein
MIRRIAILSVVLLVLLATGDRAAAADGVHPRIVSFSPALTRIMFDMGLGDHVVGVTRFCHLPDGVDRPRVGDAQDISARAILAVGPDIVITQSDVARFKGITDVAPQVKIVASPIERLADVPKAIELIGELTGRQDLAAASRDHLLARLSAVGQRVAGQPKPRALFVMGTDRPSVAGGKNFVHDLIELAGGVNVGADIPGQTPWRRTHIDAIVKAAPDVVVCQVLVAAQAEEAREYWRQWKGLPAAEAGRVYVVTDPDWSIPSTKLAALADTLAEMIHGGPSDAETTLSPFRAKMLRWLAAALVGGALAAGGMAMQGLLRNPLAEPYILGVSSGAGVGVLLGMAATAWWSLPEWASLPALAFIGALATCTAVYMLAQRRGRLDPYTLILAGVIVNTFNGAIMLGVYLYVDMHRIADFTHWMMGRLEDTTKLHLLIMCGACVVIGWIVLLTQAARANVLSLGDNVAATSGVAVHRLRLVTFGCVGLMTAAAVSLAGPIGFVGLIVPHLCRFIVGPDQRIGLVASAIVGAVLLVLADSLCRSIGPWIGVSLIPVGILTALVGGPFFVVLLRRRRERAEA